MQSSRDSPRTPRHWDGLDLTDGWHVNSSVDESTEHHNALRYLLKLASADEHFKTLVRGAFDVIPNEYLTWAPFTKMLSPLLHSQSATSTLGDTHRNRAVALETAFYTFEEGAVRTKLSNTFEYLVCFKWIFSAAAVAISYLQQHPYQRSAMRRIILEECRTSVSNPEVHMFGFLDICCENPSLHLVRHMYLCLP